MKWRRWLRRLGSGEWSGWPQEAYEDEKYRQRLAAVQNEIVAILDKAAAGPVRVLSLCAGDGRDLIGALQPHPRRSDVNAWLVELSPQSVEQGLRSVKAAGLEPAVTFLNQDATDYATYRDVPPVDLVLVCGVWGHVPSGERAQLVNAVQCFSKPGASVIWTRGLARGRNKLDDIEGHFSGASWKKIRETVTDDGKWAVMTHEYRGGSCARPQAGQIFHFTRGAGK